MRIRVMPCLLGYLLLVAACSDLTAPRKEVRRYLGYPPGKKNYELVTDWYNCASWDGGQMWNCEYDHTDYNGTGGMDYFDSEDVFHTSGDCMIGATARYCDNNFQGGGGMSPYSDPRELGRADPDDDLVMAIPTCPANSASPQSVKAYCAGNVPNAAQLDLIYAALNRMRQIGGICGTLAGIGDALLSHSPATLRVYPQGDFTITGHAPVGGGSSGPNSWAIISQDFIDQAYDSTHVLWYQETNSGLWYKATLQTVLAHELDHLHGAQGHISENGGQRNILLTPNTRQCSDVDMGTGLAEHP